MKPHRLIPPSAALPLSRIVDYCLINGSLVAFTYYNTNPSLIPAHYYPFNYLSSHSLLYAAFLTFQITMASRPKKRKHPTLTATKTALSLNTMLKTLQLSEISIPDDLQLQYGYYHVFYSLSNNQRVIIPRTYGQ